jgi:hypothetical protein
MKEGTGAQGQENVSKGVEENVAQGKEGKALVCVDFDHTIVDAHYHWTLSGSPDRSGKPTTEAFAPAVNNYGAFVYAAPAANAAEVEKATTALLDNPNTGVKNPEKLGETLKKLIADGHDVAITSFSLYPDAIKTTLGTVLTPGELEKVKIIAGFPKDGPGSRNAKTEHMELAMKEFNVTDRSKVVLVDDSTTNVDVAKKKGFKAVQVPMEAGNTAYLDDLNQEVSKIAQIGREQTPEPAAVPSNSVASTPNATVTPQAADLNNAKADINSRQISSELQQLPGVKDRGGLTDKEIADINYLSGALVHGESSSLISNALNNVLKNHPPSQAEKILGIVENCVREESVEKQKLVQEAIKNTRSGLAKAGLAGSVSPQPAQPVDVGLAKTFPAAALTLDKLSTEDRGKVTELNQKLTSELKTGLGRDLNPNELDDVNKISIRVVAAPDELRASQVGLFLQSFDKLQPNQAANISKLVQEYNTGPRKDEVGKGLEVFQKRINELAASKAADPTPPLGHKKDDPNLDTALAAITKDLNSSPGAFYGNPGEGIERLKVNLQNINEKGGEKKFHDDFVSFIASSSDYDQARRVIGQVEGYTRGNDALPDSVLSTLNETKVTINKNQIGSGLEALTGVRERAGDLNADQWKQIISLSQTLVDGNAPDIKNALDKVLENSQSDLSPNDKLILLEIVENCVKNDPDREALVAQVIIQAKIDLSKAGLDTSVSPADTRGSDLADATPPPHAAPGVVGLAGTPEPPSYNSLLPPSYDSFAYEPARGDDSNRVFGTPPALDEITQAVREGIIASQQSYLQGELAKAMSPADAQAFNAKTPAEMRTWLGTPEGKAKVDELMKSPEAQAEMSRREVAGYKQLHEIHKDSFQNVGWSAPQKTGGGKISFAKIERDGVIVATLAEKTVDTAPKEITLEDGTTKVTVKSYRQIEFPTELKDGNGPAHFSMAVKDENGKNIAANDAVYFTAHYDDAGKLMEISSPKPVKFTGTGDDAVGYIEREGKIYTLPVTKGMYEKMERQVAENKGLEAGLGHGLSTDTIDIGTSPPAYQPYRTDDVAPAYSPPPDHPVGDTTYSLEPPVKSATMTTAASSLDKPAADLPKDSHVDLSTDTPAAATTAAPIVDEIKSLKKVTSLPKHTFEESEILPPVDSTAPTLDKPADLSTAAINPASMPATGVDSPIGKPIDSTPAGTHPASITAAEPANQPPVEPPAATSHPKARAASSPPASPDKPVGKPADTPLGMPDPKLAVNKPEPVVEPAKVAEPKTSDEPNKGVINPRTGKAVSPRVVDKAEKTRKVLESATPNPGQKAEPEPAINRSRSVSAPSTSPPPTPNPPKTGSGVGGRS